MNLAACSSLRYGPETGVWFRAIQPQFWTTSLATAQTMLIPSRFNEGANAVTQFEVLYLTENSMVALFEVQALFGSPLQPGSMVQHPRQAWIVVNVNVTLQRIVDLTNPSEQSKIEVSAQELTGDWRGYQQRSPLTSVSVPVGTAPTQELGQAVFMLPDMEGFYAISAKIPYHKTLVVFPEKLMTGSRVEMHHPQTGQRHIIQP